MIGSVAVGAWIAYIAFPILLVCGYASGELGRRGIATACLTCLAAYAVASQVPHGQPLFVSAVASIDIALVLAVSKSDIRI